MVCPICESDKTEPFNRNSYLHLEQVKCLNCKTYWIEDKHGHQRNIIEYAKVVEPISRW